ncbi:hypothetical protein ApDm4_2688 [Acetobacter pomorum]|nr:hypothetical protein ApDm4_2688 [Acetobacter pomorum]
MWAGFGGHTYHACARFVFGGAALHENILLPPRAGCVILHSCGTNPTLKHVAAPRCTGFALRGMQAAQLA